MNYPPLQTFSSTTTTAMDETEPLMELLSVSRIVLLQAVDALDQHFNADHHLTFQSKLIPGSTIGKHLRHARDHFELLLDCISTPPPYVFSYDTRIRNTPMESSRTEANRALLDTVDKVKAIVPTANFNAPMQLQAVTPHLHAFETSFGRELWFAILHCVHHWSMVRVIAGELGIALTEDFGFAPSTLVYHDREAPLGKAKF